jgi:ABC-type transport system involved in multi-copper enzyme maturation permease subunit
MAAELLGFSGPVALLVVTAAFLSTVVGLYIGYQAYRGFRRHESASMRYLSIGLILLTAVTYSSAFLGSLLFRQGLLPLSYRGAFQVFVRLLQLAGLLCIAYSLRRRP